jgi:hypothetical protein
MVSRSSRAAGPSWYVPLAVCQETPSADTFRARMPRPARLRSRLPVAERGLHGTSEAREG